jgi:long-chain fatty acid transport protein
MRPALAFLAALAALAALVFPALGAANPVDMYGLGSRASALGGAVTAEVGDPSAVYYNPAGLARLRALRIDAGYFHAAPALALNGRDIGVAPSHGLVAGVGAPGRVFGLPFAVGLALHLPDDRISQVRAFPQTQPRWELYGVRLQRLYIAAMLAVSPVRWLRLGGGVAFMAATRGAVDLGGTISLTNGAETGLTHAVDADLTAVRYAQLGAQADLGRGVSVGLAWRDAFQLDLTIDLALRGRIVAGPAANPNSINVLGAYTLASRTLTAYQPQQWVAGAAWVINPRWRVMVDLTFARWSGYENPTSSLQTRLDLSVPAALAGVLRVPSLPPSAPREAMRFRDTLATRVGAEFTAPWGGRHALQVRAGYAWDPSPVPAQAGLTSFFDGDRHTVSAGLGLTLRRLGEVLPGTLRVDVHAALQIVPDRVFARGTAVDPTGDVVAGGLVPALGATSSVEFD